MEAGIWDEMLGVQHSMNDESGETTISSGKSESLAQITLSPIDDCHRSTTTTQIDKNPLLEFEEFLVETGHIDQQGSFSSSEWVLDIPPSSQLQRQQTTDHHSGIDLGINNQIVAGCFDRSLQSTNATVPPDTLVSVSDIDHGNATPFSWSNDGVLIQPRITPSVTKYAPKILADDHTMLLMGSPSLMTAAAQCAFQNNTNTSALAAIGPVVIHHQPTTTTSTNKSVVVPLAKKTLREPHDGMMQPWMTNGPPLTSMVPQQTLNAAATFPMQLPSASLTGIHPSMLLPVVFQNTSWLALGIPTFFPPNGPTGQVLMGLTDSRTTNLTTMPASIATNDGAANGINLTIAGNPISGTKPNTLVEPSTDSTRKRKRGKREKSLDCPKRPLSAYNFFFRDVRAELLRNAPTTTEQEGVSPSVQWDMRKKRPMPHGKFSFTSLGKSIGKQWQQIDPERLVKYNEMAIQDKERYELEMIIYRNKGNLTNTNH